MDIKLYIFYFGIALWVWIIFRFASSQLAKRMLFHPEKELLVTPKNINLPYEDVHLTTTDKKTIHGWFIPHPNATKTILFLHGNAGNISHRIDELGLLHYINMNILIIDYRGYGKSTGKLSEKGLYRDAEAAYDYLVDVKKIPQKQIICFGRSLGGVVAIRLALNRKLGALIISSTFTSLHELIKTLFSRWLGSIFCLANPFKMHSIKLINYVNCPLLIIHGVKDELVPYSMAKELYEKASNPKLLYPIEKATHNDTFIVGGKKYWYMIEEFTKKSINELQS